jgi:hypothetical protein
VKRLLLLILLFPLLAHAQSDPLNSAYLPSIDSTCTDYASNVWVTNSLYEVYQNTGTKDCTKWAQTYYGTQNETVDFQIHLHDTGSGTNGFQVTVSSFSKSTGPGGNFTISAPSASARDIVVYREAYINVTTTSGISNASTPTYLNIMQNTSAATTGFIPDILIPAIDPYYHQTTTAFPFNVAANNNQSVLIDVHVPTTAPSGYYLGTVTVQSGCPSTCTTIAAIPIIIAVWQWPNAGFMPSTATLQGYHLILDNACAGFYGGTGFDSACSAWPGSGGSASTASYLMKRDFATLYLDHRLQGPAQVPMSLASTTAFDTYYGPLMNGTANTILSGAKINSLNWSDDGGTLQQYATHFSANGWTPTLFLYGPDEPSSQANWQQIYSNAANCSFTSCSFSSTGGTTPVHSLTPSIPQLITTSFRRIPSAANQTTYCGSATCVTNSIDWLTSNVIDMATEITNLATYQAFLAGSSNIGTPPVRKWWSYSACDSTQCGSQSGGGGVYMENPSNALDTTSIAHRVQTWFDMYVGQTGDLYFLDVACWAPNTSCGNSGDPWAGVRYGGTNGDGTLVYPGRVIGNPTGFNNVGVTTPIFLPSLRLKHLRDGMQDYEIMNVLKANGQSTAVTAAINSFMVTTTGNGTGPKMNWSFNNTQAPVATVFTSDLPDARQTLGAAMHALSFSTTFPGSGCAIVGSGPNWSCAAGAASTDVNGALSGMADGATLTFQAGSYNFSAPMPFLLTKGATLICATAPNAVGAATGATGCNITIGATYAFGIPTWTSPNGVTMQYFTKLYRVSGFNWVSWPNSPGNAPIKFGASPSAQNSGTFTQLRFDHNTFNVGNLAEAGDSIMLVQTGQRSYFDGVSDHNLAICPGSCRILFGSNAQMDPLVPPGSLGTGNNFFTEDNTIQIATQNNAGLALLDWDYGTQGIVIRHNTSTDGDWSSHYTQINYEYYNNQTTMDANANPGNPPCYRTMHTQGAMEGAYHNNNLTCSTAPGPTTPVLSIAAIRDVYRADPRTWPTTMKCTGFIDHFPFTDGNRLPSQTNQGYPCLYQQTRDMATRALVPMYAWNNVASGTPHGISLEDLGFGQNPDYYTNHLQPNRDYWQSINTVQTSTTAPWNCTTNADMGWGPITNRPLASNCPTYTGEIGGGMAYAAQTTPGTIGSSGSGVPSDTVVYQLGAFGWTQFYKPYAYPHPLVSGAAITQFPTISPPPAAYTTLQNVTLSCPDAGAVLYVTTDGTAPTHTTSHTSPYSFNTVASGKETVNVVCSLGGTTLDSLTLSGGYYINAQAYSAWPMQPGTYPAGTLNAQISNPGQNVQICATADGSTPAGANGICSNQGPLASGSPAVCATGVTACISTNGINQFETVICTATCTISFLTTGLNLINSPITTVKYTMGGTNSLWWEDVGGSDAGATNFAVAGTPVALNFGTQAVNITSGTMPIYLNSSPGSHSGPPPATTSTIINSIVVAGLGFARAPGDMCAGLSQPVTLAPGSPAGYCSILVTFTPPSTGTFTGTVTINDNTVGSPHVINLTGIGAGSGAPTATLTPNPLNLGNQNINTTGSGSLATLTNTGAAPVIVSGAQTFSSNFTLVPNAGSCFTAYGSNTSFTLPVGQNCTFLITFTPTATTSYSSTFQVTDNAAGSPQTINLTGQGTVPVITWSSPQGGTTYNFGTVNIGSAIPSPSGTACTTTPSSCLELINTGTGPLNVSLSITGTNPALFSPITSTNCPSVLAAGANCTVVVTFTPLAATSYTANLHETDSVQSISGNLTLNGTGQTPPVNLVAPWPSMIISQNRSPNETDTSTNFSFLDLGDWHPRANTPSRAVVDCFDYDERNRIQRLSDYRCVSLGTDAGFIYEIE